MASLTYELVEIPDSLKRLKGETSVEGVHVDIPAFHPFTGGVNLHSLISFIFTNSLIL